MSELSNLFPDTYEFSRDRFRKNLAAVQALWPQAELSNHPLSGSEDLTIDWIYTEARIENEKVFILTTAEHGVEGYVGSAMLQRFIERYMPRFNPDDTGLLLVHAINPWGMKHKRRTNANNVDLNRNFVWDASLIDPQFNPGQRQVDSFVNPKKPVNGYRRANLLYMLRLPFYLVTIGFAAFKKYSMLGHYRNPQGVHFGGDRYQEETLTMMNLYQETFAKYNQILLLDMHTGYGPRYQMNLVNSGYEKTSAQDLADRFAYPAIMTANTDDFYELRGDMIDYVYQLQQQKFPDKRIYANSYEFGTYGYSVLEMVRSMRAMSLENRAFHFGCGDQNTLQRVRHDFEEAFSPQAEDWRAKAVADGDQAFEGIFKAEGFMG